MGWRSLPWAPETGRLPLAAVECPLGPGPNGPLQAPSQGSGHLDLGTAWADPRPRLHPGGARLQGHGLPQVRGPAGWGSWLAVLVPCGGVQADSPLGARPSCARQPGSRGCKGGSRVGLGHGQVAVCPTGGAKGRPLPSCRALGAVPEAAPPDLPSFTRSLRTRRWRFSGSRPGAWALSRLPGMLCPSCFGREPSPPLLELASVTA